MRNDIDYVRLVKQAQLGDKQGLERLTELAEERLREDVSRITLNSDLMHHRVPRSVTVVRV